MKLVKSDLVLEPVLADSKARKALGALGQRDDPIEYLRALLEVSVDEAGFMYLWIDGTNAEMDECRLVVNAVEDALLNLYCSLQARR